MHELPVMKEILFLALRAAKEYPGRKIVGIHLVIGDFSSIVDDSLKYYFRFLVKNTPARYARLHITRTQAIASCPDCRAKLPVALPIPSSCVRCYGTNIRIDGGRDFFIDHIEIDDEDSP